MIYHHAYDVAWFYEKPYKACMRIIDPIQIIINHQISPGLPEITWWDKFQINHLTIMFTWNYENCWVFSKRLDTNTLAVYYFQLIHCNWISKTTLDDAYKCQWVETTLVKLILCHPFYAKPSLKSKHYDVHSKRTHLKMSFPKCRPFVSASIG